MLFCFKRTYILIIYFKRTDILITCFKRTYILINLFLQECNRHDSTMLLCFSPMFDKRLVPDSMDAGRKLSYGFRLDGVQETLNLTAFDFKTFDKFTVYPDPELDPFPSDTKSFNRKNNDYLTINVSLSIVSCSFSFSLWKSLLVIDHIR